MANGGGTMKAVRLVETGKPLRAQELPKPDIGERDVLVRVKASGICHSDAHYRAGVSPVASLPLTLGHEVSGLVEEAGSQVTNVEEGDRVCIHYLVTCGACYYCSTGNEQFCASGAMVGKHRDGGYAEYVSVPARNVFPLPEELSFEEGAVLMCSSATSFHALRKAALRPGETVAVFGVGGLGMSAVQLARGMGALDVYAVDVDEGKLKAAAKLGAIPVNAASGDPVQELLSLTGGEGVDVTLELVGLPATVQQAVRSLAIFGRAVMVGIGEQSVAFSPYNDLLLKEAQIIGSADHLAQEIPLLIELTRRRDLSLSAVIAGTVPLQPGPINEVLDRLEQGQAPIRTVILP
jgi:D-arabinose 1-dehydrogenase-like Zn-dependent alcohol dehydrogenase